MKIYTKTGDKGQTSLLGGKRVPKDHNRIEAYGSTDELNSNIGLLRSYDVFNNELTEYKDELVTIQNLLFTLGSHLSAEKGDAEKFKLPKITQDNIDALEQSIDKMNEALPPMTHFILPGGDLPSSQAHVCRSVCRRAERACIRLTDEVEIHPLIIPFLNRLSDYLFVLSRYIGLKMNTEETRWVPKKEG